MWLSSFSCYINLWDCFFSCRNNLQFIIEILIKRLMHVHPYLFWSLSFHREISLNLLLHLLYPSEKQTWNTLPHYRTIPWGLCNSNIKAPLGLTLLHAYSLFYFRLFLWKALRSLVQEMTGRTEKEACTVCWPQWQMRWNKLWLSWLQCLSSTTWHNIDLDPLHTHTFLSGIRKCHPEK